MSLLWKIGGIALVAGALFLLVRMYGGQREELGAANEAKIWQQKVIDAEKGKLVAYQAGVASVQAADARYVETVRDRIVPVTRTLIERATAYAATPDGASLCLAADRVQSLEQTGRALFNPATPSAGVTIMPPPVALMMPCMPSPWAKSADGSMSKAQAEQNLGQMMVDLYDCELRRAAGAAAWPKAPAADTK